MLFQNKFDRIKLASLSGEMQAIPTLFVTFLKKVKMNPEAKRSRKNVYKLKILNFTSNNISGHSSISSQNPKKAK